MKTGTKIRNFRMERKLTQLDMADALEISQRAYSKIENNEVQLKIDRLEKIATLLNVEVNRLLPENGNMNFENVSYSQIGDGQFHYLANDKERELYEKIISNQKNEIEYLKGIISSLK